MKRKHSGRIIILTIFGLILVGCGNLKTIPDDYCSNGEQWLAENPHVTIGGGEGAFVLAKPSSSFIVYALGVLTVAVGIHFIRTRESRRSRKWWGFSLVVWGMGTFLAGTSYQAFAYEIKCAGQGFCSFTSWFEIFYLILEVLSINGILLAVAYSLLKNVKGVMIYSALNSIIYTVMVLVGSFVPLKPLITFETMLFFAAPGCAGVFILSLCHYLRDRKGPGRFFLAACLILFLTTVLYYLYYLTGITHRLWEVGIWFSANDVLHVGLMIWMVYLWKRLSPVVTDLDG